MKKVLLIITAILIFSTTAYAVDYSQFDVNDINAANKAVRAYHEEFKDKKGSKEAENGYAEFRKFYFNFFQAQSPKIEKEGEALLYQPETSNGSKIKFGRLNYRPLNGYRWVQPLDIADGMTKKYSKYGLTVLFNENFFYTSANDDYLYRNFAPYLSKEDKILMKFYKKHFNKTWISDGHYAVKKEEIKAVIKFYKNFQRKYPEYSKEHNIESTIQEYEKGLRHYPVAAYNFSDDYDVTDCIHYFELYDKYGLDAINKAVQGFQKEFENLKGTEKADNGYYEFYLFHTKFCETLEDKIEKEYQAYIKNKKNYDYNNTGVGYVNGEFKISLPKIAEIFSKKYQQYGIKIYTYNEHLEPGIDYEYVYKNIAPYLSQPQQEEIKSYLK